MKAPQVSRPPGRRAPVLTVPRRLARAPVGPDPEVIARAGDLLRMLDAATGSLTDVLDVTGFPAHERRKDVALLSTLASGLPGITLDDVIEALRELAIGTGPAALFPGASPDISLPDEARELLYVVEPLAALTQPGRRLPRHAGARLRAAPLLFSLSQSRAAAALAEVIAVLRQIVRLPMAQPELTTIRQPLLLQPRMGRRESTALADMILVLTLLLGIAGVLVILFFLAHATLAIR
ncbi:MAG TPA: hypothetical protein VKQ30_07600 [Ktedonobacterales bacterium]|nr:hypothetical protein [Ktedonobacterales bacterium]